MVPVSACLCMSGLQVRWWMLLHGGLHLIRKALVRSLVGPDLPRVLRLSLRFCESVVAVARERVGLAGMLAVAVMGRAGWAVVVVLAVGGVRVRVLGRPVGIDRYGGDRPGGSSGGGVSPPSC
jgi:hypothetical protein